MELSGAARCDDRDLPYYFLHLDVPGAGPQPSCWNPRGCPIKSVQREQETAR
jgi:hypothetical protein